MTEASLPRCDGDSDDRASTPCRDCGHGARAAEEKEGEESENVDDTEGACAVARIGVIAHFRVS